MPGYRNSYLRPDVTDIAGMPRQAVMGELQASTLDPRGKEIDDRLAREDAQCRAMLRIALQHPKIIPFLPGAKQEGAEGILELFDSEAEE